MELFSQILGMTLIVLGLLTVVISLGALFYVNVWPGLKDNRANPSGSGTGAAANEQPDGQSEGALP